MPPAPARFSITTAWPSASERRWLIARLTMSLGPPGGNGSTMRIGRVGYGVSAANAAVRAHANAVKSRQRVPRGCFVTPFLAMTLLAGIELRPALLRCRRVFGVDVAHVELVGFARDRLPRHARVA